MSELRLRILRPSQYAKRRDRQRDARIWYEGHRAGAAEIYTGTVQDNPYGEEDQDESVTEDR